MVSFIPYFYFLFLTVVAAVIIGVAGATAVFLMLLGGYLLWTDIFAPLLGIKTED